MKRQYYALFSCNIWKEKATMSLQGVFTEKALRKKILKKIKDNDFEYDGEDKDIKTESIDQIDILLKYGFIQSLSINEEL